MGWLAECAKRIAHANKSVQWRSPLGFPICQPYSEFKHVTVGVIVVCDKECAMQGLLFVDKQGTGRQAGREAAPACLSSSREAGSQSSMCCGREAGMRSCVHIHILTLTSFTRHTMQHTGGQQPAEVLGEQALPERGKERAEDRLPSELHPQLGLCAHDDDCNGVQGTRPRVCRCVWFSFASCI